MGEMKKISDRLEIVGLGEKEPEFAGKLLGHKMTEIKGKPRGYFVLRVADGRLLGVWENAGFASILTELLEAGYHGEVILRYTGQKTTRGNRSMKSFDVEVDAAEYAKLPQQPF
jgi:hypothetical protein